MMPNIMESRTLSWSHVDVDENVNILIDLQWPDNAVGMCCAYVYALSRKMHGIVSDSLLSKQSI